MGRAAALTATQSRDPASSAGWTVYGKRPSQFLSDLRSANYSLGQRNLTFVFMLTERDHEIVSVVADLMGPLP